MGQTLVQNYLHIVFSTKNREPFITPEIENDLHAYLGGICNKLDCPPIKVGGHVDHVHLLVALSKNISLMNLLKELKIASSNWIKTVDKKYKNFYWQDGYGAFSVNINDLQKVINYISNQHKHHRKKTFREEFLEFLQLNQLEYDERYLWS